MLPGETALPPVQPLSGSSLSPPFQCVCGHPNPAGGSAVPWNGPEEGNGRREEGNSKRGSRLQFTPLSHQIPYHDCIYVLFMYGSHKLTSPECSCVSLPPSPDFALRGERRKLTNCLLPALFPPDIRSTLRCCSLWSLESVRSCLCCSSSIPTFS